jgi:hypothetical protein
MRPLTIHRLRSVFVVLNGSCLASLLRSLSSLGVIFRDLSVRIVGTTAFGGGGFTVWGCFSLNCKIDLYVIDGTLRGQKYRDQILRSLVMPHS